MLSRKDFKCPCCSFDVIDYELWNVLAQFCSEFDISINSGARCKDHNKAVKGSPNSQHLLGKAADVRVGKGSLDSLNHLLEYRFPNKYGIGLYRSFIHLDVREKKARWDLRDGL